MEMPPQDMQAFEKVVLAGMKIMYDKTTFPIFKSGMMKKTPLPQRLATEAAGLMKMLMDKSKNSIPKQIIAPAAAMLLMEMGKFMTEAGIAKPKGDDIRQATMMMLKMLQSLYAKKPGQAAPAAPPQGAAQPPMPPQGAAPQQPAPAGLIGA